MGSSAGSPSKGHASLKFGDRPVRASVREDREHGLAIVEAFGARFASRHAEVVAIADRVMLTRHMNVARVHKVERAGPELHVVGEWVEGETWADLARISNGAVPLEVWLRVIVDALAGLAALHADEIVHGGALSSSLVVGGDGVTRVARVCPAALGRDAWTDAERASLAPEVLAGDRATTASDVWGAGALLWEALARRRYERGAGAPALAEGSGWAAPLAALAARALATDPGARPAPAELAMAIRTCARTRLASHDAVADAVREFATDHLLERRRRIDQSTGGARVEVAVTAFDADTAPKGRRTVPASGDPRASVPSAPEWASEAPTLRRRAVSVEEIADIEISEDPPEVVSASSNFGPTGARVSWDDGPPPSEMKLALAVPIAPVEVDAPRATPEPIVVVEAPVGAIAPAPESIAPPRPRRRSRAWLVAIGAAAAVLAIAAFVMSARAPREAAVAPPDPSPPPRAPAVAVDPPAPLPTTPAPSARPSATPSASVAPKPPPVKRPPPLRPPGQYDPTSI